MACTASGTSAWPLMLRSVVAACRAPAARPGWRGRCRVGRWSGAALAAGRCTAHLFGRSIPTGGFLETAGSPLRYTPAGCRSAARHRCVAAPRSPGRVRPSSGQAGWRWRPRGRWRRGAVVMLLDQARVAPARRATSAWRSSSAGRPAACGRRRSPAALSAGGISAMASVARRARSSGPWCGSSVLKGPATRPLPPPA
jgi:hypothetical protein